MTFETVLINNVHELIDYLLSYKSNWMFRGHASDSWLLESTLERALKPIGWDSDVAKVTEEYCLFEFKARAHHYVSQEELPSSKLGWLSLMQHHGVPTRLLDFTESPFIALFFAFDGVQTLTDTSCALWALDYRALTKKSIEIINGFGDIVLSYEEVQTRQDETFEFVDQNSYDVLWTTEPGRFNLRLERQKGSFLISGNIGTKALDLLNLQMSPDSFKKIVIPTSLANDIYIVLKKMGINNARMFSDIDGLGKDVKNEISYQVNSRLLTKR